MLTVNKRNIIRTFPDSLLPNVCLQVCGGGYTPKQTADATLLQSKVSERGYAIYGKGRNVVTITMAAEPDMAQAFDVAYEDQCRDACGL